MKKILILSYFYPPANFVGGLRVASWAKYLNQHGYYPIIVTRNWNPGQKDLTDKIEHNQLHHEKNETHEVYRLPYKQSLRDKLADYKNSLVATFFRKSMSLFELVGQNFWLNALPYSNFYTHSLDLIKSEDIKLVIASGRPFQLFSIASKLKKKTGTPWLADYRDEWNSWQNKLSPSLIQKMVNSLEKRSELEWTDNVDGIISVTDYWANSISKFIKKPYHVVMNGYEKGGAEENITRKLQAKKFIVSYLGTLYPHQDIEKTIAAFTESIDKFSGQIEIEINFVGLSTIPAEEEKVKRLTAQYPKNFKVLPRLPKAEIDQFYESSDLMLATGFTGVKGCMPTKLFECGVSNIPLLLYPSDNDSMEEFVKSTNCGYVAQNHKEATILLEQLIQHKISGNKAPLEPNKEKLAFYSRENQTARLAEILNKYV